MSLVGAPASELLSLMEKGEITGMLFALESFESLWEQGLLFLLLFKT